MKMTADVLFYTFLYLKKVFSLSKTTENQVNYQKFTFYRKNIENDKVNDS